MKRSSNNWKERLRRDTRLTIQQPPVPTEADSYRSSEVFLPAEPARPTMLVRVAGAAACVVLCVLIALLIPSLRGGLSAVPGDAPDSATTTGEAAPGTAGEGTQTQSTGDGAVCSLPTAPTDWTGPTSHTPTTPTTWGVLAFPTVGVKDYSYDLDIAAIVRQVNKGGFTIEPVAAWSCGVRLPLAEALGTEPIAVKGTAAEGASIEKGDVVRVHYTELRLDSLIRVDERLADVRADAVEKGECVEATILEARSGYYFALLPDGQQVSLQMGRSPILVSDGFTDGDRVRIYYDGRIMESYPAQLDPWYIERIGADPQETDTWLVQLKKQIDDTTWLADTESETEVYLYGVPPAPAGRAWQAGDLVYVTFWKPVVGSVPETLRVDTVELWNPSKTLYWLSEPKMVRGSSALHSDGFTGQVIRSKSELEELKLSSEYETDQYTSDYFSDKALVLLNIPLESGSMALVMNRAYLQDDTLVVKYATVCPPAYTCDMAYWWVLLEFSQDDLWGVQQIVGARSRRDDTLEKLYQIQSDWTEQQVYALLGEPDRNGERSVVAEVFYTVGPTTEATIQFWSEGITISLYDSATGERTVILD